ncbi:MAG: hypothetical protein WD043_05795 [Gemmatimonadales bacterium]
MYLLMLGACEGTRPEPNDSAMARVQREREYAQSQIIGGLSNEPALRAVGEALAGVDELCASTERPLGNGTVVNTRDYRASLANDRLVKVRIVAHDSVELLRNITVSTPSGNYVGNVNGEADASLMALLERVRKLPCRIAPT